MPSSMAFFGLHTSPVSSTFSIVEVMCCAHDSLAQFGIVILILPHLFAQVFRPLWPFFAASGITYYLVSKAHDIGVHCVSFYQPQSQPTHTPALSPILFPVFPFSRGIPRWPAQLVCSADREGGTWAPSELGVTCNPVSRSPILQ